MSLVRKNLSWVCSFCNLAFPSPKQLCRHVVGDSHRSVLSEVAPNFLIEVGRLQSFLDTYLRGEPIIGLEYVWEQQAGSEYLYTCLLCEVEKDWLGMFNHVTGINHVERYIAKHHPLHAPSLADFPHWKPYAKAVFAVMRMLCETFGARSIRYQREVAKNGEERSDSEENPSKRKKVMDSESGVTQPTGNNEVLEYLQKFTNRDHFCSLCNVSCPTAVELYQHVTGNVHQGKLAYLAPEQRKESTRLHSFLDTYMKGEPILGLGFIAEKENCAAYVYTCLLCGHQAQWPHIFTHLVTVDHMARYMEKYHHVLGPKAKNFRSKGAYVKAIFASAIRVYRNLGDASVPEAASEDDGQEENLHVLQKERPCFVKKIPLGFPEAKSNVERTCSVEKTAPGFPAAKSDVEWSYSVEKTAPGFPAAKSDVEWSYSVEKTAPGFPAAKSDVEWPYSIEKTALGFPEVQSDEITQELEVLGVSSVEEHHCRLCLVSCPNAVALCMHLMGTSHRRMLGDAPPEVLQKLCSLKYYLGTLLKDEPFVGLEYVEEIRPGFYNCLLCQLNVITPHMLTHIGGARHITLYITGHTDTRRFPTAVPNWMLKQYASQICGLYGRKEIRHAQNNPCSPAESQAGSKNAPHRKVVREVISGSTENAQTLKIEFEVTPTGGAGDIGDPAWEDEEDDGVLASEETTLLTSSSRDTHVEFKSNKDFLDYLGAFQIRDEADALLIQQISQNCSRALKRFLEEVKVEEMLRRHRNEMQMYTADT